MPSSLIVVIEGLIVLFVVASDYFVKKRARRRVAEVPQPAAAAQAPVPTK